MSNRTVFDNDGVAHAWARGAEQARTSNGNFYSHGRRLYSYGSHFIVGVRLGVSTFVLNSDRYSKSTSRHQSAAGSAAHGDVVCIPELNAVADTLCRMANSYERGRSCVHADAAVIRNYLVANATKLDDFSGAWLANYAGFRESVWTHAKALRAKLDAAKAKADAKAKRERETRNAKQYADMTDADWRSFVRREADGYCGEAELAKLATALRRARIVAKREGLSLKRLNAIRSKLAGLEAMDSVRVARIAHRQRDIRVAIGAIRQILRSPDAYSTSNDARTLAHAARRLASLAPYVEKPAMKLAAEAQSLVAPRQEAEEAERKARYAREEAERRQARSDREAAWLRGDGGRGGHRFTDSNGGALIRAVGVKRDDAGAIIGGTLETGEGADVPLVHAVRAFRFVKLIRERGETWARNGRTVRVGHYQIDRVDADGFTAGCHRINWPEIERLARELGVIDAAPCDAREAA